MHRAATLINPSELFLKNKEMVSNHEQEEVVLGRMVPEELGVEEERLKEKGDKYIVCMFEIVQV